MSATQLGQRIAVFVVFTALATAVSAAIIGGVTGAVPSPKDLEALEAQLRAAARLHTPAALPAPAGSALFCAECHPAFLHPGTGVALAMLNEHASRMDCLLCHWPAAGGSRPAPAWQVQAGATAFLSVLPRERSSRDQLSALRAAATAGRRCFERGPACAGCHRPGGLGALGRPGSTPARAASIERLEDYFKLEPGEKWYFPNIR